MLLAGAAPASAQDTIKIGLIMTLSGQFADAGIQMDNGVKTYMKEHGDTVGGKKIEIIRKDSGGMAPDVAKRLAQELVVRDKVDIIAGFVLTPNALAAGDVSAEAKKFMVVMNAATSIVTTKSPYMVRSSVTLPQVAETFGTWAATKGGIKKSYTMVTDYGPGHDFEAGFQRAFKEAGGEIIGSVRFPVANPDFSAFIQRAKDLNPESIMIFVPGGAQPAALGKAFAERGVDPNKIKILGSGETTSEQALEEHGRRQPRHDHRLALRVHRQGAEERRLREAVQRDAQAQPGLLLDRRLRRHARHLRGAEEGRRQDRRRLADRGGQGAEVGQPARPDVDRSRDPRRGADHLHPQGREGGGEPQNVAFDKVENVKDPVKARMPK